MTTERMHAPLPWSLEETATTGWNLLDARGNVVCYVAVAERTSAEANRLARLLLAAPEAVACLRALVAQYLQEAFLGLSDDEKALLERADRVLSQVERG